MRAAAQVGESTILIKSDGTVLQVADQLALVLVAFFGIGLEGIRLGDVRADEGLTAAGQLDHLIFNFPQICFHKLPVAQVHIVVETVLDGRSDAELDAGIQCFERFGHQVAGGVPEHVLGLAVLPFVKLDRRVFVDRAFEIVNLVVHRCAQYICSEAGTDARRDLVSRRSLLELFDVAVRKCDLNHYN